MKYGRLKYYKRIDNLLMTKMSLEYAFFMQNHSVK